MAETITFTKLVIKSFTRKPDSGVAKVTASLTQNVIKKMQWGEAPNWQKTSHPVGKLAASLVEFKPKHSDQQKHAFDLDCDSVDGFEITRVEDDGATAKKTKAVRTELHFSIHFTDHNGARKIEQYMQAVTESTATVHYERPAEQLEIIDTTAPEQSELPVN